MTKRMNEARNDRDKEGSAMDGATGVFPRRRTKYLASLSLGFLTCTVKVIIPTLRDD